MISSGIEIANAGMTHYSAVGTEAGTLHAPIPAAASYIYTNAFNERPAAPIKQMLAETVIKHKSGIKPTYA